MIEITTGTIEERIIKILKKKYPITVNDLKRELNLSKTVVLRHLQKLQTKGYLVLEPLSNETFIRLLRHDFRFVGKKRQRKFIKHSTGKKPQQPDEYDGIMYS
jgi:predicted ArsR family transcriptional regulator